MSIQHLLLLGVIGVRVCLGMVVWLEDGSTGDYVIGSVRLLDILGDYDTLVLNDNGIDLLNGCGMTFRRLRL